MKLFMTYTEDTPVVAREALSKELVLKLAKEVCEGKLGGDDVLNNPGAYIFEKPTVAFGLVEGEHGINVNMVGVSRGERTDRQLQEAVDTLKDLVCDAVYDALVTEDAGNCVQVFCAMTISNDKPEPGDSSTEIFESAEWLDPNDNEDEEVEAELEAAKATP